MTNEEEILALDDVKSYLRVDHDKDDALILGIIKAAREYAENFCNITILKKEFKQINHIIHHGKIHLNRMPLFSVLSVKADGRKTIKYSANIDDAYVLLLGGFQGMYVSTEYIAGFDSKKVPESIKTGMLMHIAAIYDQGAALSNTPKATLNLYSSYKKILL